MLLIKESVNCMKRSFILAFLLFNTAIAAIAQVGTWKAYMAYYEITDVQKVGDKLYVLASNDLYTYNTNDQSVQTYDKTNGLSDCGIEYIAWCQTARKLLIVYSNGNFDFMDADGEVENLPDFYNKAMNESKTIYDVNINGRYAYISTGFGLLKIDVANASINETYKLGFKVDYSYIDGGNIYAASSTKGIYTAPLSQNLQDPSNWSYAAPYTANSKTIDPDLLNTANTLSPGGPKYNHFNYMYFKNDRLYTSGGGWALGKEYLRPGCVQVLEGDTWSIYQDDFTLPHNVKYRDATSLAIDPTDPNHVFASNLHCGLIEFRNGKYVANYTYDNSPFLSAVTGNPNYVRVDGIVYGNNNSLYMFNSESGNALIEYSADSVWTTHKPKELYTNGGSTSLAILRRSFLDSNGQIWFINDHSSKPSLFCYDVSKDSVTSYDNFINQDGTSIGVVFCRYAAEDSEHNIWLGTDVGPLMLTAEQQADNSLGFTQVKVPRNDGTDLADYLLSNVDISSIAVDGAGRKWFGTSSDGVYLISSDNLTQINHFTTDNSPLLSNTIEDIAINGKTGEVFFGTDNGLCSYVSDATDTNEEMDKDNVYAYPNPVRPEYTGTITVVGLSYNADVKIVAANGRLVYEGRSNGGSFTWNGCDRDGKRVASGVYMVETAASDGGKGTVCKIAILK